MKTKIKSADLDYLEQSTLELLIKSTSEGGWMNSSKIVRAIPLMGNTTKVRSIINNLRQQGEPIISNSRGYRYTTDIVDIFIYTEQLKNRINQMTKAYTGIIEYVKKNTPDNLPDYRK